MLVHFQFESLLETQHQSSSPERNPAPFPSFSDSYEIFSTLLPPATLATFAITVLVPTSSQPSSYWRERRPERGRHIPTLNVSHSPARLVSQTDLFVRFDETDNPIYIFQRNQSSCLASHFSRQASPSTV